MSENCKVWEIQWKIIRTNNKNSKECNIMTPM